MAAGEERGYDAWDQTSLAASPHLWTTIEEALAGSGWLILMASPALPGPPRPAIVIMGLLVL